MNLTNIVAENLEFKLLEESLDTSVPYILTNDTNWPTSLYAQFVVDQETYSVIFIQSKKPGVYKVAIGRVPGAYLKLWSIRPTHLRRVLSTTLNIVSEVTTGLSPAAKGIAIQLPKESTRPLIGLLDRLIRKRFIGKLRSIPVKNNDATWPFLFVTRVGVPAGSLFGTKEFKQYDFSSEVSTGQDFSTAKLEIPAEYLDDLESKVPIKATVSNKPSTKWVLKQGVDDIVLDPTLTDFSEEKLTKKYPLKKEDKSLVTSVRDATTIFLEGVKKSSIEFTERKIFTFIDRHYENENKDELMKMGLSDFVESVVGRGYLSGDIEAESAVDVLGGSSPEVQAKIFKAVKGYCQNNPISKIISDSLEGHPLKKTLDYKKAVLEKIKKEREAFLLSAQGKFISENEAMEHVVNNPDSFSKDEILVANSPNFFNGYFSYGDMKFYLENNAVEQYFPYAKNDADARKMIADWKSDVDLGHLTAARHTELANTYRNLYKKLVRESDFAPSIPVHFGNDNFFPEKYEDLQKLRSAADIDFTEEDRIAELFKDYITQDTVGGFAWLKLMVKLWKDTITPEELSAIPWFLTGYSFIDHAKIMASPFFKKLNEKGKITETNLEKIFLDSIEKKKVAEIEYQRSMESTTEIDLGLSFDYGEFGKFLEIPPYMIESDISPGYVSSLSDNLFAKDYTLKNLGEDQRGAVYQYTGPDYADYNNFLRKHFKFKHTDSAHDPVERIQKINKMAKGFEQVPPLPFDMVVFRNTDVPKKTPKWDVNTNLVDPGFMSTTMNPQLGISFGDGKTTLIITLPKGCQALAVDTISSNGGESEVILPAFTVLKPYKVVQTSKRQFIYCVYVGTGMKDYLASLVPINKDSTSQEFEDDENNYDEEYAEQFSYAPFTKAKKYSIYESVMSKVRENLKMTNDKKGSSKFDEPAFSSVEDIQKLNQLIKDGKLKIEPNKFKKNKETE